MLDCYFSGCDYANDFEALVDAHEFFDWVPELECDIWFKAYDTSCHENEHEIELDKQGYKFDCYMFVSEFGMLGKYEVYNKPAKTQEEAKKIMNDMAATLLNDKKAIELFNKIINAN